MALPNHEVRVGRRQRVGDGGGERKPQRWQAASQGKTGETLQAGRQREGPPAAGRRQPPEAAGLPRPPKEPVPPSYARGTETSRPVQ